MSWDRTMWSTEICFRAAIGWLKEKAIIFISVQKTHQPGSKPNEKTVSPNDITVLFPRIMRVIAITVDDTYMVNIMTFPFFGDA